MGVWEDTLSSSSGYLQNLHEMRLCGSHVAGCGTRQSQRGGDRQRVGDGSAVDLGVLSTASVDVLMATGAFLGDRTDILPSVEDRTKTRRRWLWEEQLTSPETRTADTEMSWLPGVAGISTESQRFNSITPEAPPDLEFSGF